MAKINLKSNFVRIYDHFTGEGERPTNFARKIGFITATQLQNVLSGKSQLSTQAIIGIFENLNVNPTYLFLGKGDIFATEEAEIERLRKESQELAQKQKAAEMTIREFKEAIDKLEKRNADLIDLSTAAIQYHKSQRIYEQTNTATKEIDDAIVIKVLKQLGLMNENDTELNLSKIISSLQRKRNKFGFSSD